MCFFVFLFCFVFGLVFCFCDSSLQLNMLNDLAKAMKVLDGKKVSGDLFSLPRAAGIDKDGPASSCFGS